jgi:YD repeat-containing protein
MAWLAALAACGGAAKKATAAPQAKGAECVVHEEAWERGKLMSRTERRFVGGRKVSEEFHPTVDLRRWMVYMRIEDHRETWAYDAAGHVVAHTYTSLEKSGRVTSERFVFDAAGRPVRHTTTESGGSETETWRYDAAGHALWHEKSGRGHRDLVTASYDGAGRLLREEERFDAEVLRLDEWSYGPDGPLLHVHTVPPIGSGSTQREETRWEYVQGKFSATRMVEDLRKSGSGMRSTVTQVDAAGRPLRVVVEYPIGSRDHEERTEYDANGRVLHSVSVGGDGVVGAEQRLRYDAAGRVIEKVDLPDRWDRHTRTARTTYDAAGRALVTEVRDETGAITDRTISTYDAAGRLTSVRSVDGSGAVTGNIETRYDAQGRPLEQIRNQSRTVDTYGCN